MANKSGRTILAPQLLSNISTWVPTLKVLSNLLAVSVLQVGKQVLLATDAHVRFVVDDHIHQKSPVIYNKPVNCALAVKQQGLRYVTVRITAYL